MTHWPTLRVLCRDFYNSVHPSGNLPKDNSQDGSADRITQHRKKVKQWFLNPTRYSKEIDAEQAKHPGPCIYHLSSSHPTETCHIKIDCDKKASTKKPGGANLTSTTAVANGHLRYITGDIF
jgi:hypothetical protein